MGGLGQLGVRIASAVGFVLCAWISAGIVADVGESWLAPAEAAVAPLPVAPTATRAPTWDDRKPILDRNLFGAELEGAPPPPELEPDPDLEETKLPLTLLGTAAANTPGLSTAVIRDDRSREDQVVSVGERLEKHQQVEVLQIQRRRVVLRNGPRQEVLTLEEELAQTAVRRPQARARTAARRPTRSRPDTRISTRLRELREEAEGPRSTSTLFQDARILPKYEDGEMVGVQLSNIKEGSLYEQFGFEDGDVVTGVNGVKIDNPAASTELIRQLSDAEELVIERNDGDQVVIPAEALEGLIPGQ